MKKRVLLIFSMMMLVVISTGFVSCSDDDDDYVGTTSMTIDEVDILPRNWIEDGDRYTATVFVDKIDSRFFEKGELLASIYVRENNRWVLKRLPYTIAVYDPLVPNLTQTISYDIAIGRINLFLQYSDGELGGAPIEDITFKFALFWDQYEY